MENSFPQYVTKEAMNSLVQKLKLPKPDQYTQDWEYEVADSSRVSEFISFYENNVLNDEEKFALMIIIVSSYNDALEEMSAQPKDENWDKISNYLLNEINIHKNTIYYWALEDEQNLEDCFAITPLVRDLLK